MQIHQREVFYLQYSDIMIPTLQCYHIKDLMHGDQEKHCLFVTVDLLY